MAQQTMSEKDMYLAGAEREFQTTLKCFRNFPADKLDYKPHPRSMSARDLMWTIAGGHMMAELVARKEITLADMAEAPPAPKTLHELIAGLEQGHKARLDSVRNMSDAQFNALTKFPTGKDKTTELRRADILWFMAMDGIHHRGQLSVYLRMAGGKVPAIYGPSADEPWQ